MVLCVCFFFVAMRRAVKMCVCTFGNITFKDLCLLSVISAV